MIKINPPHSYKTIKPIHGSNRAPLRSGPNLERETPTARLLRHIEALSEQDRRALLQSLNLTEKEV